VQPDSLLGYCESQADASGGTAARVVDAVKGAKDPVQRIDRNTRSGITDHNDGFPGISLL
jgi:hypothetical protein